MMIIMIIIVWQHIVNDYFIVTYNFYTNSISVNLINRTLHGCFVMISLSTSTSSHCLVSIEANLESVYTQG